MTRCGAPKDQRRAGGLVDLVNRDGEALAKTAEFVKDGGRVATTMGAADDEGLGRRGVAATNVFALADPASFSRLIEACATGHLTVPTTRTFSLDDLREGLDLHGAGQARGKYVVTLEG